MSDPNAAETDPDDEPADDDGAAASASGSESAEGDADATARTAADEGVGVDAVGEELVERIEESDPEELANEVASLRTRLDGLESDLAERDERIEELESKLKRKQAEFQNYKKRTEQRMEEERERATEDLVERLLDVRDNLVRALDQNEGVDIRDGVASTLGAFDDELERENVDFLEPEPGDDIDPVRHEVLVQVDSDQPEGTVAEVHRPGYEMAGKVIRPAQVTVSEG